MCPNDWEWGRLSWSINFDCLPNDYSSANNSAAACACTDTNMIHGGFPLRATVWFSRCRTPTRGRYLRGGGVEGVSQQLVWLFICLSRASRPGVIILLRVCVKGDDDPEQRWCERGKGQRMGDGRAPRSWGAEPGSSWASWATRCGCRWHPLQRREEAGTITAFFVCLKKNKKTTLSIYKPHLTPEHNK